jgi:hypothetical protein
MSDDIKAFSRLNFFTGFQTTADDWNQLVAYDVEKHKLHSRIFHAPGVVTGQMGSLKVSARGRADMSVEIAPGVATDGQGNDLILGEPAIKTLVPTDYKLPQTVYLVLKYAEDLSDYVSYKANLEYKGHRRVAEQVKVEAIITEPDLEREVEIARIHLGKGVKRITDAKDPREPGTNEIDRRYIPFAGSVGCTLTPTIVLELSELVGSSREVYSHMFHQLKILPASDVLHALISLDMLIRVRLVDWRNIFDLYSLVFELQLGLIRDIDANYPQFSSKKEFASFKKHVELLVSMHEERAYTGEYLTNVIGYQRKSTENLMKLFSTKLAKGTKKAKKEEALSIDSILDAIKIHSDDFEETLELNGIKLKRVDVIDVLKKRSESDHKFKIVGARDKYRTRQKLKYPDGVIVEDIGMAFEGGHCEFEVLNTVPNKDLVMVMRMDYVHGDWEAEVEVNGKKTANWTCEGDDRKFRWRNWPYKLGAESVTDTFLSVKVTPITADRDVNMFKIWFYQPA